ncbi:uncharacterized protein LOC141660813 [Apium graveolens]|uniref:uncharacterized protein LOC141660813 n=1 Tax=Apium graveolens TaxID=4045 RepID=UPI003D79B211
MRMRQNIIDDEDISLDSFDFMNHVQGENEPLYPGCESFTKMRALVKLYNLKAKHGISDKCFSDVLLLLASMLPEGNSMPSSFGEAKKTLCTLGMDYEKIYACPNDCLLYRGERDEDETICRICGASGWKLNKKGEELEGIPAKVLWYFPLIPRLRNLFNTAQIAKDMTWHKTERQNDGKIKHPADSKTWKDVDQRWPEFIAKARNLRLALSSDGFNPFHGPGSDHSTWPVLLSIYNLPPWLCMKRKYIMLSLLISGPNQSGNDIDVYLQPLIEDLQKLWHGKQVYDAFKKESFILRGILLWTISDYPALGNLSGNIIKGYNACVVCVDKTKATRLATYKKMVVMRHRRWLPRNHPYRRQKLAFDNTMEKLSEPIPLTGEELEYWKFLPVRHTLDVMHIEKNICEALTGTLLNIPGKTKDRESVRIYMAEMGIRMELRPKHSGKKEKLPMASWNLLHKEKKIVCSSLIGMKLPDGFCSNLKGIVSMDTLRLVGMKSHNCHTMLHHLLPIALRSVLQKQVRCTIIRFCLFFKAICSKVIEVDKLEKMQSQLVETLCQLEKHFPPSLFDVMIHLSVHLVREVELCGPIFLRWMYPFERYMKTFKGYVRNRAHPEGCIAEAYIAEEAVECLVNFEEPTVGLPGRDKNKEKYRPLSGATMIKPSIKDLHQAHLCLLQNSNELTPYFNEHMAFLVARYPLHENDEEWLKNKQNETFPNWFQKKDKDKNIEHISHTFYGVITSIWELDYNHFRVPIFRCNWVDMNKWVKIDDLGYTVVNLHKLGFLNDPFVLGKHVKQVCYIDDPLEKFWSVVLKLPNKFNDQSDDENEGSVEIELENEVIQTTSKTPLSETLLLNRAIGEASIAHSSASCLQGEQVFEAMEDVEEQQEKFADEADGNADVWRLKDFTTTMEKALEKFKVEYFTILSSNAKVLAPQEVYDIVTELYTALLKAFYHLGRAMESTLVKNQSELKKLVNDRIDELMPTFLGNQNQVQ